MPRIYKIPSSGKDSALNIMSDHESDSDVGAQPPMHPPHSPGSSVSTRFEEEYEELLRYAVVVPTYDGQQPPPVMNNGHQSFPRPHPSSETAAHYELQQRRQQELQRLQEQQQRVHEQQQRLQEEEEQRREQQEQEYLQQWEEGQAEMNETDATVTDAGGASTDVEEQEEQIYEADVLNSRDYEERREVEKREYFRQQQHSTPRVQTPERALKTPPRKHTPPRHVPRIPVERELERERDRESNSYTDEDMGGLRQSIRQQIGTEYSTVVDADITHFETLLDEWQLELKQKIMNEYSLARIKSIEAHRAILMKEKEQQAAMIRQLQDEIEEMKELLHTYEQTLSRKDAVISNLSAGLQKSKEKIRLASSFSDWKQQHSDARREEFTSKLAAQHYERVLVRRHWSAWRAQVEGRWKERLERACQNRAQQLCINLTAEYEAKIRELTEALEQSRIEVQRLREERETYEETMKKAFMRGVCALNLEAMNMFNEQDSKEERPESAGLAEGRDMDDQDRPPYTGLAIVQEPVYNTEPPGAPIPRTVSAQPSVASRSRPQANRSSGTKVTARVTARTDSGMKVRGSGTTLNPPMSSVVVERHPPVNKETMGHAVASQYPSNAVLVNRRIAGQTSSSLPVITPNIHNVKVVD